jgi:hypothetical protein
VRFGVTKSGEVESTGTNDVRIKVLGSSITYGAGGPKVAVRVAASTDGEEWLDLFDGRAVEGNETQTLQNVPSGAPIRLRINGRYSWLFKQDFFSKVSGKLTLYYFSTNLSWFVEGVLFK